MILSSRAAVSASILAAVLPLASCAGDDHALRNVEHELSEKYLRPLSTAGLTYEVQDTCRLALQPADPAWHLQGMFLVDAEQENVATILRNEGIRLNDGRDPIRVQQEPGDPQSGWNGSLAPSGTGTLLALTYNNVDVDGISASGGWGEPCPLTP
jgi:hypothetical protein